MVAGLLFATAAAMAAGPASNPLADMSGRRDVLSGGTDDTAAARGERRYRRVAANDSRWKSPGIAHHL